MPNHAPLIPTDNPEIDLFDRARLIKRWRHGSASFFFRHERSGRLKAVSDGTKVRYRRKDVYDFEGGQPPWGMKAAYQSDLITQAIAARLCSVAPSYILTAARRGELPTRRIGSAYRFVPAEVEAWQQRRFLNRKPMKNRKKPADEQHGG